MLWQSTTRNQKLPSMRLGQAGCCFLLCVAAWPLAAGATAPNRPAPIENDRGLDDLWLQAAKLTSDHPDPQQPFGSRVALSGDTALVGVSATVVGPNIFQGAVYVFVRNGDAWAQQTVLIASDGAQFDDFGISVALVGDTALVGADGADVNGNVDQGAAYVFTRSGEIWSEQAKITAADGMASDNFGSSVALADDDDGDTALVGAIGADVNGNVDQGAAYVFIRNGEAWSEQGKLTASDGGAGDILGDSVALSGDDALVGGSQIEVDGNLYQGAAYVFTRSGGIWTEQTKLTASDGAEFDSFGLSVAMSGNTAMVGAFGADVEGNVDQGAVYVFSRAAEEWSEQTKLIAPDGEESDLFGLSVAVSGDTALIGAPLAVEGDMRHGTAYVFARVGETWSEEAKLSASDGGADDFFGFPVALSGDTAMLGASGGRAAYVFANLPSDSGVINGTVLSLGHCGANVTPLAGATVEITGAENTYTVETVDNGLYQIFLPDSESPLDITVASPGHLSVTVEGIGFNGGDTVTQDFDLMLDAPCVSVDPTSLSVELAPDQTTTEVLAIDNGGGAAELLWSITTAMPPAASHRAFTATSSSTRRAGTDAFGVALSHRDIRATTADLGSTLGQRLSSLHPIQPAGGIVDCGAEPGIVVHDDGTIENGYSGDPYFGVTEVIFVDRFTPTFHPASFDALCLAFVSFGPTELEFEIVVFDDDGGDGAPGTELGTLPVSVSGIPVVLPAPPIPPPVWFSFDLAPLAVSIDSGSVFIGVRWAPSTPNVFITADESPGNPAGFAGGYWWNDTDDAWMPIESGFGAYRSLFVRAVEGGSGCDDPTAIPWLRVAPVSGSVPPGGTSEVQVTLETAGLVPGTYESRLCLESNDPFKPLIVVPVDLTVTETGVAKLTFEPSSLDFGEVEVGVTSLQIAMLHNTGDVEATGLGFTGLPDSGFEANANLCGDILPAGESCEVMVTFTPAEPGPATAALHATSSEGASADLALAGIGVGGGGFTPMDLEVDPEPFLADGNGVFEPGELVEVAPAWRNDGPDMEALTGTASNFDGLDGSIYFLALEDADYGNIEPGITTGCRDTGVCYFLAVNDPAVRPSTHWQATFDETLSDGTTHTWSLHIGDSFFDVPRSSPFYPAVETLLHHGVTGGCTATEYCPAGTNTRGQMAVFLLKAAEGGEYVPPACEADQELFADVPFDSSLCPWIEELAARQVTSGCGGGNYCPGSPVTRAQMAVFLLKAFEGGSYTPPECTGEFTDVTCPSTFAAWVEELFARGITGGCSADPPAYCPAAPVPRQQMAVFVTKTFGLALYGP